MCDRKFKPICVLCLPRCGSNLLIDSLARHPQAVVGGGWFDQWLTVEADRNRRERPAECNLFKLHPWDLAHVEALRILDMSAVVFLYRDDASAQLESWRRACETGWWVAECRGEKMELRSDAEEWLRWQHALLPLANTRYIYETMIADWDNHIQHLLSLAGWDVIPIAKARQKLPPNLPE